MWGGPIHNKEFVGQMLEHIQNNSNDFNTASRIEGMLAVAHAVRALSDARSIFRR
jgi:tRNA (guanine26-N2/guanine27-N2)-dimethyltransferase